MAYHVELVVLEIVKGGKGGTKRAKVLRLIGGGGLLGGVVVTQVGFKWPKLRDFEGTGATNIVGFSVGADFSVDVGF